MRPETKYKGSIKLSAIGDALGWITEFEKNIESVNRKFGTNFIDSFHTWKKNVGGRFFGYVDTIKEGSYSDDTQLLLAVARSIRNGGKVDNSYFAKIELSNWLLYARGGGRTVKTAAEKIQRKSVNWNSNFFQVKQKEDKLDYREAGANGAAMRVLPIALANFGNPDKIKEEVFCNSIVTHGHPRAIIGAILYAYAVNQMLVYRPEDFRWENFLTNIGTDLHSKFAPSFFANSELQMWLSVWNKGSKIPFEDLYFETVSETQNQLRFIYNSLKGEFDTVETLTRIGCFDPSNKGSGISTVVAGIYLACKHSNDPVNAITAAVNLLGSDTDSIAAFVGGLIGALHGQSVIPEKWKKVQDNNYFDIIATRLLAISEESYSAEFETSSSSAANSNLDWKTLKTGDSITFQPLGLGSILSIDVQRTLTKGKYNKLFEVQFEIGQSVCISVLIDDEIVTPNEEDKKDRILIDIAKQKLRPILYEELIRYISKHRISKELQKLLIGIINNEDS